MPLAFAREQFTFTNPDGTEFTVLGWGNQHHAVFETLDGYTVVRNPDTGFYDYARLSDDKNTLIATGVPVETADPDTLAVPPHIRVRRAGARVLAQQSPLQQAAEQTRWQQRRRQRRAALRQAMEARAAPPSSATVGDYVGLCLLIDFPDIPGTVSRQEVDDFCNQPGYSGYSNNGSVSDYFREVSAGRFRYTNVVAEYYTASNNRDHYTDPSITYGTRARQLIIEALDDLSGKGFDFSQLSADSEDYIYALNVFYAGDRVNNWSEGLWPHAWVLASPYDVGGGKRLNDYQITNMGSRLTLRTFCHENGHMVCDFPDLYDYGGQSHGVGHYCLMCYGGSDTNPVHVNGYLKYKAGWATRITDYAPGVAGSLEAGGNEIYRHSRNAAEYFVIENRQQQGRDAAIPDAGLAIWHIDELGSNDDEQMTPSQHYECSIEQADNQFDLESGTNTGDSEDLFAAPHSSEFSPISLPGSGWWDGSASGLELSDISASGQTMTFNGSKGGDGTGVQGVWDVVRIDWGCDGSVGTAGPFAFDSDGTWNYRHGTGKWSQVGDLVIFDFDAVDGLVYSAVVSADSMTGMMAYVGGAGKGCFSALRAAPSSAGAEMPVVAVNTDRIAQGDAAADPG